MNWIKWAKSSYSAGNGACVQWGKSSYSGPWNDCVEVGRDTGIRLLRDSKDPTGPVLQFTEQAALEFLAGVKADEFDR